MFGKLIGKIFIVALGVAVPLVLLRAASRTAANLEVVPSVDLDRYSGTWYEIARLPNRFQRKCAGDTTATYTLRPDGKITVLNQCRKEDGSMTKATATARVAGGGKPNSILKVTFFWPFSGDYWILDLDPDYQWALVGEPGRKYLWVLSREPQIGDAQLTRILERAARQGFDITRVMRTRQSAARVSS